MLPTYLPGFSVEVKDSVLGEHSLPVSALVQENLELLHLNKDRFERHTNGAHSHHLLPDVAAAAMGSPRWVKNLNGVVDGFFAKMASKTSKLSLIMRGKKRSEAALASERKAIDDFIGRKSNGHFLEADWKPSHFTQSVLGEGYGGTVRLVSVEGSHCHSATVYAVKEFSRKKDDSTKHYSLRIEPEFYAAFKLKHAHVVQVFDTLPVSSKTSLYCQVMEYCHGRDLFYHVSRTSFGLVPEEANCFFRQLLSGVAYMHSVGLAHRDLKPENLLLTADGCLKIADFGASVRFTTHADGDTVVHSRGITGTMPYIAPEIFCQRKYDARLVDVWGCVIIYKLLRTKEYSWFVAKGTDIHFKKYVRSRVLKEEKCQGPDQAEIYKRLKKQVKAGQWEILEGLEDGPRDLLYQMLEPEPGSRIHISGILKNAWFCSISSCHQ